VEWVISIAVLLLVGLVMGALAKFLMPGDDPGGIVATSILGILGAIVGGFIAHALNIGGITGLDWRSLITAVGGALLLLLAYRAFLMLGPGGSSPTYVSGRSPSTTPLRAYGDADDRGSYSGTNLAELAKETLSSEVVNRLSEKVGESPGAIRSALEAMIPTVLASAKSLASTPSGASRLFDLAKGAAQGGLERQLIEGNLEAVGRQAHSFLNTLFGDKLAGLLNWLARFAGIKESSASTLMNEASSLVMTSLGRTIQQKGLDATQLGHLLSSQAGWLTKLLPSGIGNVPGMRALTDLGDRAAEAGRATVEAGRRVGATAQGAYRETVGAAQEASPLLSALLPLALLLLPLVLFTWLMRGAAAKIEQQKAEVAAARPAPAQPAPAQPQVVAAPEVRVAEPSPPVTTAGKPLIPTSLTMRELRLPDGVTLNLPESSFLHEIYKYLSDATATHGRAFAFDGLDFDNATIRVLPETETAVTSLTALLRAFPTVTLRIEGYTDATGDPAADQNRSLAQAEALKALLVKAGVPGNRITTAGFGSEKPVATNDTPEGRAKNRRIELSLSKPS
jgi:outer membrane protein OmpA-like peptidoglycan-associated protein/uncharacterized membrane protein YeaQ/YmgE (transglycosylase-associated protein family)